MTKVKCYRCGAEDYKVNRRNIFRDYDEVSPDGWGWINCEDLCPICNKLFIKTIEVKWDAIGVKYNSLGEINNKKEEKEKKLCFNKFIKMVNKTKR